jgi:PIN domain nuclease of toxin-antitoxin system
LERNPVPEPGLRAYVADTHSLIWYLTDSPRLSPGANRCFKLIEEGKAKLLIPAIVMAEIIYIVEKGKVEANLDDLIDRIREAENFELSPLGIDQLLCLKNEKSIQEMHDRLIVCEALINGAIIITKDEKIKAAGIVEVLW